ncbi:alpha/beta fold hydrolase [Streptomyces sp. NPDC048489]|uniref:alpha/beta hydrolase n=1 Tax=Streptomyces sp. NPDC048489 TaxID=3154504 RepID=UPI00343230E3
MTGKLYLPSRASAGPAAAVVVTGAWGTVKEQMAAGYARELAARGYAALTFDFRGWGESEGRPRSMEDPFAKAADITAAAEYLASRTDIDANAIGALGICASSAYLATAASRTDLIKSVVLVAPAVPSPATVAEHLGGDEGVTALRAAAATAQQEFERTGVETLVPSVPPSSEAPAPGADYYTNPERGNIPEWDNTFNMASWTQWFAYDAQAAASDLKVPLLTLHSAAAAAPDSVREFVARVPQVTEIWLDEVSQFDFYDQPGPMDTACDAAAEHFASTVRRATAHG